MNVMFLINSLGAGGAERSTLNMTQYLIEKGYDCLIICLSHKEFGIEAEAKVLNVPVIFLSSHTFIGRYRELNRLIASRKPDLVHAVLFEASILLRLIKFFNPSLPSIESLVNTSYAKERAGDLKIPRYKLLLVKIFDMITARLGRSYYHAITATVLEHYRPLFGIQPNEGEIIFRGRKTNEEWKNRVTIRKELGVENSIVLINTGRHEYQKGQWIIIQALGILKRRGFDVSNIRLFILGREGNYTHFITKLISENGLGDIVTLTGFKEDVEKYLAASDVFIFPSFFEGLGGALVEAFATRLPCICSDLPVLREVVGSEDGALFFKTGDPESLSMLIEKIVNDTDLRKQLSKYSYNRFSQAFSSAIILEQMLTMYKRQSFYGD